MNIDKYLKVENQVYEITKEFLVTALVIALAYRVVVDVPVEGPLDQCLRYIVIILGYLLIPGFFFKFYAVFLRKKDHNV